MGYPTGLHPIWEPLYLWQDEIASSEIRNEALWNSSHRAASCYSDFFLRPSSQYIFGKCMRFFKSTDYNSNPFTSFLFVLLQIKYKFSVLSIKWEYEHPSLSLFPKLNEIMYIRSLSHWHKVNIQIMVAIFIIYYYLWISSKVWDS